MTPNNSELPFFFVSDNWTVFQIEVLLARTCWGSTISDPIAFNSTGTIEQGSVVQYYRGASAAVVLPGYEAAKELPNNPHLAQNPPFPSNVNSTIWECLNTTIGESIIPLIHQLSDPDLRDLKLGAGVGAGVALVIAGLFVWGWIKRRKRKLKENPNYFRINRCEFGL